MLNIINYHTIHRSGCTLKHDEHVDKVRGWNKRYYTPVPFQHYASEITPLFCDFNGIKGYLTSYFRLFMVQDTFDYNSFYSLN